MRDPDRIDRILDQLRITWKRVPDWRLGQLVVNVTERPDPFYVEDDVFEKMLLALDGALRTRKNES